MGWGDSHTGRLLLRWSCGSALALIAFAIGCDQGPAEAPLIDVVALRSIREAPLVSACEHTEAALEDSLQLVPLPELDDVAEDATSTATEGAVRDVEDGPSLLPPMELAALEFTELRDLPPVEAHEAKETEDEREGEAPAQPQTGAPALGSAGASPSRVTPERLLGLSSTEGDKGNPHMAEAELLLADAAPTATGSPTGAVVSQRAQERIRRGYALAQRGAAFAARRDFLQVLQMIAEAKDQKYGAARRTIALANGLRALEEAADFEARVPALDADLSLEVIISSHRTPVAKVPAAAELMPQQLADLYFRYAQLQLGGAVAGEPAGSMALHALGKVYTQLGKVEPEAYPQADRGAFALQQAALLARDDNHLAAHELGVLLAESGHYIEAEHLLAQVAATQPHPVVFRNWARVQRKLGQDHLAAMSEQHAQALAARNAGGGVVTWVPPATLAQTGDSLAPAAPPTHVVNRPPVPRPRPPVQPPVENITRLPGGYMR